jgi:hypothetical protein
VKNAEDRIIELLERVTPDEAEVIGTLMPTGLEDRKERREVRVKYYGYMKSKGYSINEASEILHYMCD